MGASCFVNRLALGLAQMTDLEKDTVMSHQDVESIHDNVVVHTHQRKKSKSKSSKSKPKSSKSESKSSKGTGAKAGLLPIEEQQHAAWNLNRLSHPSLPIGPVYNYTSDGTGVNVYIVDTVH